MDIKLFPGSYFDHIDCGETKQGAVGLFNFARWEHTSGCQCSAWTVGCDSTVTSHL